MDPTKERSYGLDLLRIVSMLLVVVLHLLGVGGVLEVAVAGSWRYLAAWGLEASALCAVNCYGLLSGYVGYGSRHPIHRLRATWVQVAFWCALLTWGVGYYFEGSLSFPQILFPLLPVLTGQHWYFTAYFGLYFLMPYLDGMLTGLDRVETKRLVLILMVLFTALPLFAKGDLFATKVGYSLIWLTVLYLLGACVKKLGPGCRPGWQYLLAYLSCALLALIGKLGGGILPAVLPFGNWGDRLLAYTSPFILGSALALLLLFRQWEIRRMTVRKLITFFAPLSFGVYIIHTNGMLWKHLLVGHMGWMAALPAPLLPLAVLGVAVAVFLSCALLDWLRLRLFTLYARLFVKTSTRTPAGQV